MEKRLPQNIEAERGVLGSIIIDPEAITDIADFLRAGDFYRDAHRTIYEVIVQLYQRREPADFITICDELERGGKLEEIGGASSITSLINEVPTSGNVAYYARIVERAAVARRVIHAAGEIAALAYTQGERTLEQAMQLLLALDRSSAGDDFVDMPTAVSEYMQELEFLQEHPGAITGVPTGYSDLDDATAGLQDADLILCGGRPGSGKTSFALSLAYNASVRGKRVAIFSLEMPRKQLLRRFMSMAARMDMHRLRTGWIEDDEWSKVIDAASRLSSLPIHINDAPSNPLSAMKRRLRKLKAEHGTPDLVIVDYIGLIEPEEATENRVQEMTRISRGLKQLAREFAVPVLALAQLSRKVEERSNKRPMLADLRDSGSLEQDSDVVLFLYRDAYYAALEGRTVEDGQENIAELNIAKQRNGPVGGVRLFFDARTATFYPLAPSALEEPR